MNAIVGFAQMMDRNTAHAEAYREYLDIIISSVEQLLALINHVLQTSKIESGRIQLTLKHLDFHESLRKIKEISRSRAESKGLALIVDWAQNIFDPCVRLW